MPKREIVFCGDPVLRKKAAQVTEITGEVVQLLEDMKQTMIEAPGVGLAAPQVGAALRAICVREDVEDDSEVHCILNPRIVQREGHQDGIEACLSVPTVHGMVGRALRVFARGVDLEGNEIEVEGEGLMARALQHEIDHLEGVLFVDRADEDSLGWMVPDADEECGYRFEPATLEEVTRRFEQLMRSKSDK